MLHLYIILNDIILQQINIRLKFFNLFFCQCDNRITSKDDYKVKIFNLTTDISVALKKEFNTEWKAEIRKDTKKDMDHLKKITNDLKQKIHRYHSKHSGESEEMKLIRHVKNQHGLTLNSLQQNVSTTP